MDKVRVRQRQPDGSIRTISSPTLSSAVLSVADDPALKNAECFRPKIEYPPVEQLKSSPRNARTHSEKQIVQVMGSMKQFGFINAILVDRNNQVIAGHARLEAAKRLGMAQVPVVYLDHHR